MSEAELQKQIALYIRVQYPDVIFHSDFGSGVRLTPWQAKTQKIQNGGRRAWPDMFIAEPRFGTRRNKDQAGLFIELKKEGVRLKKKNGEWGSDHIKEQAELLSELKKRGYMAEFAVGFDEAINLIDEYLGGKNARD